MNIHEAVMYVNSKGAHKKQLKYDWMFENKYSLILMASAGHKKVLDVGCAYGTTSFILKRAKMNVTALDPMPELHSKELFEEEDIKFLNKNIETDQIHRTYDLIVFTDVVEHLNYNPLPVMKKLYNLLETGGEIILTTPSKENDFLCEGRYGDLVNWRQIPHFTEYKFEDAHHHTYYLWELRDLLEEAGFTITFENYMQNENLWFVKAKK